MRVRQLDVNHDWTFGKGQNNYLRGNAAIVQNINTRLNCYLGDCFFDQGAGIDWFNLLGSKSQLALNLAIAAVILNTANVIAMLQLSVLVTPDRNVTVTYQVQTSLSVTAGIFTYTANQIG